MSTPSAASRPLVKVYASAVDGIRATTVVIEANASQGARFTLVGLPDAAVKESHQRIITAIAQCGLKYPIRRYVINMAPADIKKEGAAYDLPIAVALLASVDVIPSEGLSGTLIMGELSLDGSIKAVRGVLPMALTALREGFHTIVVPASNAPEAAVVEGLCVREASHLSQVLRYFGGDQEALPIVHPSPFSSLESDSLISLPDFRDVKGQESVKRAIEVGAAGMHNLIMVGAPGSGKSMMAKCIPSILPPLSLEEALETTMIHSVAGILPSGTSLVSSRPFRAPHHSTSAVALVGGGAYPKPGEISLAHHGILFLDEFPEFPRSVLEVLRQPLEDRSITVSRAQGSTLFPASFMLVASMNPCPCGHYNNPYKRCRCLPHQVQGYLNKVSGPLLDRIDIQVEIVPVPFDHLAAPRPTESSSEIRQRVVRARALQQERFAGVAGVYANAQMTPAMLREFVRLDRESLSRLKLAMEKLSLSARAYDRILKVSRTIADLEGSPDVLPPHISEAISYRKLDRDSWGAPII